MIKKKKKKQAQYRALANRRFSMSANSKSGNNQNSIPWDSWDVLPIASMSSSSRSTSSCQKEALSKQNSYIPLAINVSILRASMSWEPWPSSAVSSRLSIGRCMQIHIICILTANVHIHNLWGFWENLLSLSFIFALLLALYGPVSYITMLYSCIVLEHAYSVSAPPCRLLRPCSSSCPLWSG